jgi:hypothetical protein
MMDRVKTQPNLAQPADDVTVACHESQIPCFAASELERLYGQIYSSLQFFRVFRPEDGVHTYVASRNGKPVALLLFRCAGGRADVLNEMIRLDGRELRRFADYVFGRYPRISVISFQSLQTDTRGLAFPVQRYDHKEDFILALPASPEQYTALLGKSTRGNIRRFRKRLSERFSSFTHVTFENERIEPRLVRDIIGMSKARMTGKKKKFSVDDDMVEGLIRLARTCGFVNAVMIDGRLCAGSIGYRLGTKYFAFVNAHEPEFDGYWLGTLCYYLTICACIARGGTQLHMGWGRYEYKSRLLGVRQDFDRLLVYRSRLGLLLNPRCVAMAALDGRLRKLKLWLTEPQRRNGLLSRLAVDGMYVLRKLRGG